MNSTELTQAIFRERLEAAVKTRREMPDSVYSHLAFTLASCDLSGPAAELIYPPKSWDVNRAGVVHGGVVAALFDMGMGILCLGYSPERLFTTVTLNVSYLKGVRPDVPVRNVTRITRAGGRLFYLSAEIFSGEGGAAATASGVMYSAAGR